MTSGYDYRVATIDDLDSIVSLWRESTAYHEEIEDRFQYSSDAAKWTENYFSTQLPKDSFILFIANTDDDVVGFIEAVVMEKPPIHVHRKIGFIMSLFVRPQYRQKGVGSHLWSLTYDWLMKQKVTKFQLAVAAMNPNAIEFWKKLGFKELMFRMERPQD
ncbi:MAG: GNAT family N-acetyltransferase [Candidatus Thorarchaeota archaeon]